MNAIEFITSYQNYLEEIQQVVKPELISRIDELRQIDPHDLVTPETWFPDENSAKGLVWSLFMNRCK